MLWGIAMLISSRTSFFRLFVAGLIAFALSLPAVNVPAGAVSGPALAAAPPIATCDSPPDSPDATTANRDRFVQLWSARIKDVAWRDNFASLDTYPQAILDEGFHAMDKATQAWLVGCLVDDLYGTAISQADYSKYVTAAGILIFGKEEIAKLREQVNKSSDPVQDPSSQVDQLKTNALDTLQQGLLGAPELTSADLPQSSDVPSPQVVKQSASDVAQSSGIPTSPSSPKVKSVQPQSAATPQSALPTPTGLNPVPTLIGLPLVPQVLALLNQLLQNVATIEDALFTLPALNPLASATYKVCAESATMPLRCSMRLPVGVPVATDINGDNFPDVTVTLAPWSDGQSAIGAWFRVQRLLTTGNLAAHVFFVYDPPKIGKRLEFGFDGRGSTLGTTNTAVFQLKNPINALFGDVSVGADVWTIAPGSTQSLTFAAKSLVPAGGWNPPNEEDPIVGTLQMSPMPHEIHADAHLVHTSSNNQDTITLNTDTPTKVDATLRQLTTSSSPDSDRTFTATIDKLPTSVTVDLVKNGDTQSIDYSANAPIDTIKVADVSTPDVTDPGTYTRLAAQATDVPDHIHVDLKGTEDITYAASAKISEIAFESEGYQSGALANRIGATAHGIPTGVHVLQDTGGGQTHVVYDANSRIDDINFDMYDKGATPADELNIIAKATGIPSHMEFQQVDATGAVDFSSVGGIDLIEATVSQGGGSVLPMPGTDHATVLKVGDGLGLDLRLSGFTSAHFDGSSDTDVTVGLTPGGQSFDVIADMDQPNVLATAHIDALPADMAVHYSPANGTATYTASSVIPHLTGAFTDRDTQMNGSIEFTDIPRTIGLTFNTSGAVPDITYEADSRMGQIHATYSEAPGGLAIDATIDSLPQFMHIGGVDPIVFDARTSAGAPEASSELGEVRFKYGSDGSFSVPVTPNDYVSLNAVGGVTRASLKYGGLRYLSVDTSGQELHANIRNTAARRIDAFVTTDELTMSGYIDKVPAEISLDQVGNEIEYTASSPVDKISTTVHRSSGDYLTATITDVPAHLAVTFDGANSSLDWDASASVTSILAYANLTAATVGTPGHNWYASLNISGIPAQWHADFADGNVQFTTSGTGIDRITAWVSNYGGLHPTLSDGLSAYYREGSGNLDAFVQVSNLRSAGFSKLGGSGFDANLAMGSQGYFSLYADAVVNGTTLFANGGFSSMPSQVHLRNENGHITYDGNTNPTLQLTVAAGAQAALDVTPAAPNVVQGVSVRDGKSGSDIGIRSYLYLTGLPTHLDLNPETGIYQVDGYHPSIATLSVDAVLTALTPERIALTLSQVVPTSSPVDFTFGPFTTDSSDGSPSVSVDYTASQPLGAFDANVQYGGVGGDEAQLHISSIPASIHVDANFDTDVKTVNVAMSQAIQQITASVKHIGDITFAASVDLTDVPSAVSIQIGRDSASGGGSSVNVADFTMTASQPGLDIGLVATGAIKDPVDAKAAARLQITNLGTLVTAALNGKTLNVNSTPATGSILFEASGSLGLSKSLNFDYGLIHNTGNLGVNVDVNKLFFQVTSLKSLQLDLGITTGVKGQFGNFQLGLDSNTTINIHNRLYLEIDFGILGTADWTLLKIDPTTINFGNLLAGFHVNRMTWQRILDVEVFGGAAWAWVAIKPGPGYNQNPLSLTQNPNDTAAPAWLVTPRPNILGVTLSDFVLDVIAYFASPYGHYVDYDWGIF